MITFSLRKKVPTSHMMERKSMWKYVTMILSLASLAINACTLGLPCALLQQLLRSEPAPAKGPIREQRNAYL